MADLRSIFHHDFTTILHPFTTQNTMFCAPNFANPPLKQGQTRGIAPQKKFRAARNLKSADKQFALVDHLRRQVIVEQQEQLLMSHNLLLPLRAVHSL
jgi:hypothetical protein